MVNIGRDVPKIDAGKLSKALLHTPHVQDSHYLAGASECLFGNNIYLKRVVKIT